MFDSGGHRFFVTAKEALKYELPVERKEWIRISTFGEKGKESGLREVISNGHVEVVKNDFPHLCNLWFSDVYQSKEDLEIDLLIAADYLWEFQKGRTVRGESEEPVAIETELGWVLSGHLKGDINLAKRVFRNCQLTSYRKTVQVLSKLV